MERKTNGRLESVGRVGIRDKETNEIVGVYPYKIEGTDQEIEDNVKSWFYSNASDIEKQFTNCFVDALTYKELMNAKDMFAD